MAESAEGVGVRPELTQEQKDSIDNAQARNMQAASTPLNPFLNTGPVENLSGQRPPAGKESTSGDSVDVQKRGLINKLTGIFRKNP